MRILSRRMMPLALAGLTGLAISTVATGKASEYPNKPVTLIVPFQAGISVDILLRGMAEIAGQHLGQPVVVDNKAGGSATLGPAYMASNAKPDGYTIAQIPMPVLRVPHLQKVTYDPLKDFTWIIQLGGYTIGVVVPTTSYFKTFKDVVAFAKANPGKLTYTTPGPSTLNSIAMELVARKEGTTLAHVPGKGGGEAAAAILGGHVMLNVESTAWAPLVTAAQATKLTNTEVRIFTEGTHAQFTQVRHFHVDHAGLLRHKCRRGFRSITRHAASRCPRRLSRLRFYLRQMADAKPSSEETLSGLS